MVRKQTLKLTFAAMFLAISVLIPSLFHMFSVSGNIFLPMHLPVLLCGFWLGWQYGLAVGLAAPIINSLVSGMPPMAKVPFMTIELAVYGLAAGLFYITFKLNTKRKNGFCYGIFPALLLSLIAGRAVYALALTVGTYLLHINCGTAVAVIDAAITGIPGILIQLVMVPMLVSLLEQMPITRELRRLSGHTESGAQN